MQPLSPSIVFIMRIVKYVVNIYPSSIGSISVQYFWHITKQAIITTETRKPPTMQSKKRTMPRHCADQSKKRTIPRHCADQSENRTIPRHCADQSENRKMTASVQYNTDQNLIKNLLFCHNSLVMFVCLVWLSVSKVINIDTVVQKLSLLLKQSLIAVNRVTPARDND